MSENSNPHSMIENESGKSSEFMSLAISILTHSGKNDPPRSAQSSFPTGPWCIAFEFRDGDAYAVKFEQYH